MRPMIGDYQSGNFMASMDAQAQEEFQVPGMSYTVADAPRNSMTFSASNLSQLGGSGSLSGNR